MDINKEMVDAALSALYGEDFVKSNDKITNAARETIGHALRAAFSKIPAKNKPVIESKTLLEASKNLVKQIRAVHDSPEYQGIWPYLHVHGMPYKGLHYGVELKELQEVLEHSIEPPLTVSEKPQAEFFLLNARGSLVPAKKSENAVVKLSDYESLEKHYEDRILLMNKELEIYFDALYMYASPSSYHAISFFGDEPCGEFIEDFDDMHDDPAYHNYSKPGKRARAAMVRLGQLMGVEITYNLW